MESWTRDPAEYRFGASMELTKAERKRKRKQRKGRVK